MLGISDDDGLSNSVFSYQWQADGADISSATSDTYTLADADEGKAVSVKVSFTDDAGNEETLTSAATAAVDAKPNTPATGEPTINGTAQVGETLTADTSGIADEDGLDNASFSYQWLADDSTISGATGETYTLADADEGKVISLAVSFTDDAGHEETLTSAATGAVAAKPNSPATGQPAISGTALVEETLTADTSGIADDDGLDSVSYSYRWLADEVEIAGATGETYTLAEEDEGKAISVTVSFTDDAGNAETLTSAATDAVEAKPNSPATGAPSITGTVQVGETLTLDVSGIADQDGLDNAAFSYQWLADGADISGATDSSYTLAEADEGKAISVRMSFTDDAGNEETLTGAATVAVAVEARPNSPAMGAPTISGTTQVGETLTADVSGISDADGLTNATFSYQWVVNEASDDATGASYTVVVAEDGSTTWVPIDGTADTDIEGATAPTYALTEADEGRPIRVRVSFIDDGGNSETVISAPTLMAGIAAAPSSHDGESAFTFELHFSEEFGISYRTLRDHAFTVTGGAVRKVQRLEQGSNLRWRVTVKPDGDGQVSVVLPITTDCNDDGAICSADGRKLSHRLELTVSGTGQ